MGSPEGRVFVTRNRPLAGLGLTANAWTSSLFSETLPVMGTQPSKTDRLTLVNPQFNEVADPADEDVKVMGVKLMEQGAEVTVIWDSQPMLLPAESVFTRPICGLFVGDFFTPMMGPLPATM